LHTGDIVEVGAPPFIDWWAGGTLDGMIAAVDWILRQSNARTRIVPGHGKIVDRAWVARYRDMLATVGERARAALGAGKSRQEFADSNPCAEWIDLLGGASGARRFAVQVHFGLGGGRRGSRPRRRGPRVQSRCCAVRRARSRPVLPRVAARPSSRGAPRP
jgi:glyoxylase-like metal-dependent hydrolase (beta-lactamase superfamily II)